MSELTVQSLPSRASLYLRALLRSGKQGADTSLDVPLVSGAYRVPVKAGAIEGFASLCGFEDASLPLPYLFVLANDPQLAHLNLAACPYSAAGLVQRSVILEWANTSPKPNTLGPFLNISVVLEDLGRPSRGTGRDIRLTSTVTAATGEAIGKVIAEYRVRGKKPAQKRKKATTSVEQLTGTEHQLHLPKNRGREYARISGDWNPIHLTNFTARLFGFDRPIAHGLDVLSCSIAFLGGSPRRIFAEFRRPVMLPATTWIQIASQDGNSGPTRLQVLSEDRKVCHLNITAD